MLNQTICKLGKNCPFLHKKNEECLLLHSSQEILKLFIKKGAKPGDRQDYVISKPNPYYPRVRCSNEGCEALKTGCCTYWHTNEEIRDALKIIKEGKYITKECSEGINCKYMREEKCYYKHVVKEI